MPELNFISDEKFRNSLESDLNELQLCMSMEAWKAAHVLAGSIIEAVLADYLVSINYNTVNPLSLTLDQLIGTCKNEGIISQRTAELSNVIKSYRNLIHPGRQVRLEECVDENTANISKSLIEIVVKEVSVRKMNDYGYTAEQIVDKLDRDPSVTTILGHLINSVNTIERRRLLLNILPERYFELIFLDEQPNKLKSLEECFRNVFSSVSEDVTKEVTKRFITILKEDSEYNVINYGNAFFRTSDLMFLDAEDKAMAITHLMGRYEKNLNEPLLTVINGVTKYLTKSQAEQLVDISIRYLTSKIPEHATMARNLLYLEFLNFSKQKIDAEIYRKRLNEWHQSFKNRNQEDNANSVQETD